MFLLHLLALFGQYTMMMARHRILAIFPDAWDIIVGRGGDWPTAIKDADVIIPENMAVDARLLAGLEKLKLVQTGAGYDNVDIKACTRQRVWVANGSGVNARAVAEHVLGLMLYRVKNFLFLDRKIPTPTTSSAPENWR